MSIREVLWLDIFLCLLFLCDIMLLVTGRYPLRHHVRLPAAFLGAFFGIGFLLTSALQSPIWGIYMMVLAFFHFSEYVTTALFNADRLKFDCE